MIGGDLNAKNIAWNRLCNDSVGRALQQLLESDDLFIHFPDSPTHFPQNGNRPSKIDLMLTRGFPNPSHLTTDDSFTSDHVPVLCSLNLNVERISDAASYVKDFSRADWDGYRDFIDSNIVDFTHLEVNGVTEGAIDNSVSKLIEVITEADRLFVPRKKKYSSPFILEDDVKALIALRRAKIRRYKRTHDPKLKKVIKLLSSKISFGISKQVNQKLNNSVGDIDKNNGAH